ncbi:hypothetical protein TruAng_009060 [Truncatella angustata]|nr:hypothetical protein TruAng_009060 [Truncatella angustata]
MADAPCALPSASSLLQGIELPEDLSYDSTSRIDQQNEPRKQVAHKRRRTTKACDDCRRRKIKCDGCTYARSSPQEQRARLTHTDSRPRNLEALEKKLHATQSFLRRILQRVDLGDTNAVASSPQASRSQPTLLPTQRRRASPTTVYRESSDEAARFITLIDNANHLNFTNTGEYDFHGLSSGAAFLSRITQHLRGLLRYDSRLPFLPQPHPSSPYKTPELPTESANPSWQIENDFAKLPQRQLARDLCNYAFSRASCILRVIHAPSFWALFDKLYQERSQKFGLEERRFVGLLFAVMALGSMYDVDENDPTNPDHYIVATQRGHNYYALAKNYLQDITECCDITTLQALVFIIQFLQATGNLNSCHSLIGIALRSALRMGLHRYLSHTSRTPIMDETRRRLFHTIRQVDIYLSTTLGLPLPLQDKDIDQALPTEVDDEYITESTIQQPPHGKPSFLEAFNAHVSLMQILARIVDYLYPPTGADMGSANVTYKISVVRIREMEEELHSWHESLPSAWLPGPEEDLQIARIKILLRFAYAHVQMMLYRPFLQYYSQRGSTVATADERYFALAIAGINVCRNIVHIGLEIRKQAVLIGPYWFIAYTQFFAVLSLLSYAINNPDQPGVLDIFADAKLGKDCISSLSQRSFVADRVTVALNSIFDYLPDCFRMKERQRRDVYSASMSDPQMPNSPRQRMLGSTDRLQQWSLDATLTSGDAVSGNSTGAITHGATNSSPIYMSRSAQYHVSSNVMDFPMEDPFAYPLFPGVSLAHNSFGALPEDVLQLPIFDTNMNLEGEFLNLHDF